MLRLRTLLTRSLAPALCVVGVAACGGSHQAAVSTTPTGTTTGSNSVSARVADAHTLYVYSSLPHRGPQKAESQQIEQGINFVLDATHHRADSYQIRYRALSDSPPPLAKRRPAKKATRAAADRSAIQAVQNAVQAARNPQTVAYIGDLDSSATELSLPILNQAGIAQLTPGSGEPGLAAKVPGGTSSLFRLVPDDTVEADALVYWLKRLTPCHTAAAAAFGGEPESTALVDAISKAAKTDGLGFVPVPLPSGGSKAYEAYYETLAHDNVNCFVLTGHVTPAAVAFTTELQLRLPAKSFVVGTSGLCNPAWTDHARGGVPAKVDASLYCMTPVLPLSYYPHGKRFSALFRKARHRAPTAYTYYGYLAASLVVQAIRDIGGTDARAQVLSNLVLNNASTDLETYTFDSSGDITGAASATAYGVDWVRNGLPRPYRVVEP